jgi:hypothetical protein
MKEFLDELKNIHRRFSKFEFAIVLVFVLLVLLIPGRPDIIGFSDVQVHRQNIALAVDQSTSFTILPKEPVSITSLSVSGEVLGPGAVNVYLVNDQGNKLKVFSNEKKGRNLITGFFGDNSGPPNTVSLSDPVLEIKEGKPLEGFESAEDSSPGVFSFACRDSCNLKGSDSSSYELVAYVEPGTTLIINELDYTTRKK